MPELSPLEGRDSPAVCGLVGLGWRCSVWAEGVPLLPWLEKSTLRGPRSWPLRGAPCGEGQRVLWGACTAAVGACVCARGKPAARLEHLPLLTFVAGQTRPGQGSPAPPDLAGWQAWTRPARRAGTKGATQVWRQRRQPGPRAPGRPAAVSGPRTARRS